MGFLKLPVNRLQKLYQDVDGNSQTISDFAVGGRVDIIIPATLTPTGTTQEVDWSDGNVQVIDLGSASGDVTVTFSNAGVGGSMALKIIQGGTARNITWPAGVLWESDSAPTITTTNDAVDLITMVFDGTNYLASALQNLS